MGSPAGEPNRSKDEGPPFEVELAPFWMGKCEVTWDEWLHFAGTYDQASGKAALCINGELVAEVDVAAPAEIAGDWGMGARVGKNIDDARPFTGLMDEFRLLTRALSQEEILEMMQRCSAGMCLVLLLVIIVRS